MKNRILLAISIILMVVYGLIRSFPEETSFFNNCRNTVNVKDIETNVIVNIEMEDYLIGVLAGEMPASFDIEALKAQAVASRTYAYHKISTSKNNYDLTTDKSTQVYLTVDEMQEKWKEDYEFYVAKIKDAVESTKDEVLTYNNHIIPAYYFSMSNGYTENAINVFNEDRSYLVPVVSKEDTNNRNYEVTITIPKAEFCTKLSISCDKITIGNIVRNESNRIDAITINNKEYSGVDVRKSLDLRSTDFEIVVFKENVQVTTYGYGHGVGMSQYGANTMAKEGSSYKEILEHYYKGTKITSVNSIK